MSITLVNALGCCMFVKGTSAYETQGGKDMTVDLQITDMEIGESESKRTTDQANALYGDSSATMLT